MASSLDFVTYVSEQMGDAGEITWRKMFGEYGIYCNGKIIGLVCDDRLFFKMTEEVRAAYPDLMEAPPYEGAKNYLAADDVDDRRLLGEMAFLTYRALPEQETPKGPKKPKGQRKAKEKAKAEAKTASRRKAAEEAGEAVSSQKTSKPAKLDYKKAYKDLYLPPARPVLIDVPEMTFLQVEGEGNPNTAPAYQAAIEALYGLSFTIKMSRKSGQAPAGYFEYVIPPLEGFWWMEDEDGRQVEPDFQRKERFHWISMIRQPEFVTDEVLAWAKAILRRKKTDLAALDGARLVTLREGLCCQMLHKGPYDDEPAAMAVMKAFMEEKGVTEDFESGRLHHEIYLSDPRRCKAENMRTVLRTPVRKGDGREEV